MQVHRTRAALNSVRCLAKNVHRIAQYNTSARQRIGDRSLARRVQLDSVMLNPEACEKEVILNFEAKSLRDTREILQKVTLNLNLRLGISLSPLAAVAHCPALPCAARAKRFPSQVAGA